MRWVAHTVLLIFLMTMSSFAAGAEQVVLSAKVPFEKTLPGLITDYEVMESSSGSQSEYLISVSQLTTDGYKLEEKYGRSNVLGKSWLLIRNAKTHRGLAVAMAYSGNWRIEVLPQAGNTVVRMDTRPGGMPPFMTVQGQPIPGVLFAEFAGDWDDGAQLLVRHIRNKFMRKLGDDWPWVEYNTWFSCKDRVTEPRMIKLAQAAAELGCEIFMLDAGWFGERSLDSDKGWSDVLGSWTVNYERLPNGVEAVANEVRRLGMKFGIWILIERMSHDLPMAKAHPDWFLDGTTLDFGNEQVVAWAIATIDKLVTDYQLDWLKMDYNANVRIDADKYEGRTDPLWDHYRGLARLFDYLRAHHPNLIVEDCCAGSRRHDLAPAMLTDTHWLSDNSSDRANLAMNFGATYLFPAESCLHWTCFPVSTDYMDYQSCFTITMLGHFGLSGHITTWDQKSQYSEQERKDIYRSLSKFGRVDPWDEQIRYHAADRIALYKLVRPVIRNSDVYHLTKQVDFKTPQSIQVVQYVDPKSDRWFSVCISGWRYGNDDHA